MNFADTNWLVSIYIEPSDEDRDAVARRTMVSRFMRKEGGQLLLSHPVLLEARNVFSRITGERNPREWQTLQTDFDGRLYVDPMNWNLLRTECDALFSKYAWKLRLGTFDTAVVASAKLAGATRLLSFDLNARALAAAEKLQVYPPLDAEGRRIVARLKS